MRIQVVFGRRSQHALPGLESPNRKGLAYTYEADPPIAVGDIVLVPASFVTPEPQVATVVALHSDYDKPVKRILHVVEHTD